MGHFLRRALVFLLSLDAFTGGLLIPPLQTDERRSQRLKELTAERFSVMWRHDDAKNTPDEFHYDRVSRLLPPDHLHGLILDAGCGQGIDSLRMAQSCSGTVVSLDLSAGGVAVTRERTKHLGNVQVIRGDIERIPLKSEQFDFVYSYGVLHHTPHPEQGLRELVRMLKPGGLLAIYLYEDFKRRSVAERALLWSANRLRLMTVPMPPRLLYRFCQLGSPFIYLGLTLPAKGLELLGFSGLSRRIPYHHGTGPFSMAADLYDRFAAPIEKRYDRAQLEGWLTGQGLQHVNVVPLRGWLAYGKRNE